MSEGSLSGWSEGILLVIAVIGVLAIIFTGFNGMYSKDHQLGFGTNTTADSFIEYTDNANNLIEGGEADFDSNAGITLRSSWSITKQVFSIVRDFITGGFIEDLFNAMNAGEAGQTFAVYLRIIWFLSLIFAILYILFKVVA